MKTKYLYTVEVADTGEIYAIEYTRKYAREAKKNYEEVCQDLSGFRIRQVPLSCGDFIR